MRPTGVPADAGERLDVVGVVPHPQRLWQSRLGTINNLLTQTVVLGGAARVGRKGEYRFAVGRALFEPDALADDRLEDLLPGTPS